MFINRVVLMTNIFQVFELSLKGNQVEFYRTKGKWNQILKEDQYHG